jgi:hypothetical protein
MPAPRICIDSLNPLFPLRVFVIITATFHSSQKSFRNVDVSGVNAASTSPKQTEEKPKQKTLASRMLSLLSATLQSLDCAVHSPVLWCIQQKETPPGNVIVGVITLRCAWKVLDLCLRTWQNVTCRPLFKPLPDFLLSCNTPWPLRLCSADSQHISHTSFVNRRIRFLGVKASETRAF